MVVESVRIKPQLLVDCCTVSHFAAGATATAAAAVAGMWSVALLLVLPPRTHEGVEVLKQRRAGVSLTS